jgi:hypothetical protein
MKSAAPKRFNVPEYFSRLKAMRAAEEARCVALLKSRKAEAASRAACVSPPKVAKASRKDPAVASTATCSRGTKTEMLPAVLFADLLDAAMNCPEMDINDWGNRPSAKATKLDHERNPMMKKEQATPFADLLNDEGSRPMRVEGFEHRTRAGGYIAATRRQVEEGSLPIRVEGWGHRTRDGRRLP